MSRRRHARQAREVDHVHGPIPRAGLLEQLLGTQTNEHLGDVGHGGSLTRQGRVRLRRDAAGGAGVKRGGQRGRHRSVVDPGAATVALDQARLAQHLQVGRDRRTGHVEGDGQLAHARLTALSARDHAEQSEPDRVGERLEHPRQRDGCGCCGTGADGAVLEVEIGERFGTELYAGGDRDALPPRPSPRAWAVATRWPCRPARGWAARPRAAPSGAGRIETARRPGGVGSAESRPRAWASPHERVAKDALACARTPMLLTASVWRRDVYPCWQAPSRVRSHRGRR
jgi:hypothetical protein